MSDVFAAELSWDYEGCEVVGVFATKDDAVAYLERENPWCDTQFVRRYDIGVAGKGEVVWERQFARIYTSTEDDAIEAVNQSITDYVNKTYP